MKHIKQKVKAVIFDMDGTIIKTEHIWRDVTAQVLKNKAGIHTLLPHHEEFLSSLSGMEMKNVVTKMKHTFDLKESVEELVAHKIKLADLHFQNRLEFIDGFEDFHQKLRDHGIASCIATNAQPVNLADIARNMEFSKYFGQHLYCIADVNYKPKPDPALFLHAAEKLEAKPEECVVFEDSLFGFQAANAAGMHCIGIKNDLNKQHLHHTHDAISTYHEALDALRKKA